jgi:hypothetical protein
LLLVAIMLTANPVDALLKLHGEEQRARIERGVSQCKALWRKEDGDFDAFVKEGFIAKPDELTVTFDHFESNLEQLDGHFLEIGRELRKVSELELGPKTKADEIFAQYEPASHVTDDLFANKLAFVALLNWPLTTLKERLEKGQGWSRQQWAEVRLTGRFGRRVPADVTQAIAAAAAQGNQYIDEYNIWMHHLLTDGGERLFPSKMKLISHWNLRDELKADYADTAKGLEKQRMIVKVMERIVTQTIPAAVIDNPNVDWNPYSNQVTASPVAEVEADAPKRPVDVSGKPEADVRYQKLWANYDAGRKADPYSPATPTAIDRAFDIGAEMPEVKVKQLLTEVLESGLVPRVASQIEKRVGRKLEPVDLWYNGFVPRGKIPEEKLSELTRKKYPTPEAFAKDIPRILKDLGFPPDQAKVLAEHIIVDPARGAGHALQSARRGDMPHLRTRVMPEGMDYKGYNIAVHELGHNIEQYYSLYEVDHTLLSSVPNTAFTEALAFVFQAKDLELLGQSKPDAESERLRVLNDFWMTYEIAGVALVDIAAWHWMYEHPKAKPQELREATVKISKEIWNRYYAPVLGGKDTPLLGIYSHMIAYPLYLFNYPLGHLIAFQIEEQMRKAGSVGPEFRRMAKYGSVTPDLWMVNATGAPVGTGPLLRATEAALK